MMRRLLVVGLPLAAALGVVVLVLRAVPTPARGSASTTGSLAYRVPAGRPISFPIDPDDDDLALTVHVETPRLARASDPPVRFALLVLAEDPDGRVVWRGRAVLEAPPGGAVADSVRPLTEARTLRLPPLDLPPKSRVVVLVETGGSDESGRPAVLRLTRRTDRPPPWPDKKPWRDGHTQRGGDLASVFGWAYLDWAALRAVHELPVVRRAATEKPHDEVRLVHVERASDVPVEEVRLEPPRGEWIGPGAAAAWTVRGPGRLRLELEAPVPAELVVRTVDHHGVETLERLRIGPGAARPAPAFEAPPDGALTASVLVAGGAGVRACAFAEAGAVPLGDVVVGSDGALTPDRRHLSLWRVREDGPPIRATLVDGLARVSVRAPLSPADRGHAPRLAWRLIAPGGRELSRGEHGVFVEPAPFERYEAPSPWTAPKPALSAASGEFPSEPVTFVAGAPAGTILELRPVGGSLDVRLEASFPAGEARLAPAYALDLENARLRYAPYLVSSWVPFVPDNHEELAHAGGEIRLEAQVRLEPSGGGEPHGPYRTVLPEPPRVRQRLVERVASAPFGAARAEALARRAAALWSRHHRTGFETGQDVRLVVERDGPTAGRLALDYYLGSESLGGMLRVLVDGEVVKERRVAFPRGRVRLTGLPPGPRVVRVESAAGLVFTQARPADDAGNAAWVERAVWRLDRGEAGALTVPVRLAQDRGRTLNFVLYADEPQKLGSVRVRVVIDGRARGPGVHSTAAATRLERVLERPLAPVTTRWLDREGGPRSAAVFGVRLGPDLGAGTHRIRVTLEDGPARAFVRFYETGVRRARPDEPRFGIEWADD